MAERVQLLKAITSDGREILIERWAPSAPYLEPTLRTSNGLMVRRNAHGIFEIPRLRTTIRTVVDL